MRAATIVQVLQDFFYVLLHVLFYLRSLLYRYRLIYLEQFEKSVVMMSIGVATNTRTLATSVSMRPDSRQDFVQTTHGFTSAPAVSSAIVPILVGGKPAPPWSEGRSTNVPGVAGVWWKIVDVVDGPRR